MCGVAGIFAQRGPGPSHAELEAMVTALEHRGPDELAVFRDARAGLAHARLSIVDLSGGKQPLCNEDGSLWVSYNGELYEHVELRAALEARGHRFRTHSDTEVVVHAWEEWGEDALSRFNGQFAIALWDARRGELVLCRDRVGVRPLYVAEHAGRVLFASEVKALFAADPTLPRALDPRGLAETFTFWSPVAPRTAFRGVEELRPGHVRRYRADGCIERCYWQPSFPTRGDGRAFRGSVEAASIELRAALERATRLRMLRADVPVGCYLSGGLDSSLVAALAARAVGPSFRTFSLRFEDAEFDETPWQREMAARLGTEHAEVVVSRRAIADAFPRVVVHTERPLLRTAPAPMMLLSELVRSTGVRVVLTGEGADEWLAGYDLFREAKVRRFWARQPESASRPLLLERLYPYLARSPVALRAMTARYFGRDLARAAEPGFSHALRWSGAAALQRLFAPDLRRELEGVDVVAELLATLPAELSGWDPLAQDQYLEIRTLLSGYILSSQGDRMLMASSIEGRFPFLDADVMELAASLPASYKLHVLDEKHVLKRAAEGLVPASILARKKQPYRAPDASAFVGPGAPEWVDELIDERAIAAAGVFDPEAVTLLFRKCRARAGGAELSNADNMGVVGVLSTSLLHGAFVAERPGRAAATRSGG